MSPPRPLLVIGCSIDLHIANEKIEDRETGEKVGGLVPKKRIRAYNWS